MFIDHEQFVVTKSGVRKRYPGLGYRALQVKAYIESIILRDGVAPSYAMIGDQFDMDRGNVHRLIVSLEKRRLLSRVGKGRVRRIRLAQ